VRWAATTSSGGAGKRRARARTGQRGKRARLRRKETERRGDDAAPADEGRERGAEKRWRRGETRPLLGFGGEEERGNGSSSSARLNEEKNGERRTKNGTV
jgi:hypothetical protein